MHKKLQPIIHYICYIPNAGRIGLTADMDAVIKTEITAFLAVMNLRRQMLKLTTVLTFPDWHALNCMSLN